MPEPAAPPPAGALPTAASSGATPAAASPAAPPPAAASPVTASPAAAPSGVPPRPLRETVLLIAAAVALQAIVWALLIVLLREYRVWYGFHDLSDSLWYLHYAELVAQGQRVYRDFTFEYPPLALPLLLLPPQSSVGAYEIWFSAEMIALCSVAAALTAAAAAALWRGLARPLAAAVAFAAAVAAAGAITANRYDVAVALTLAAFALFLARGRTTAAAGAIGVGVALKLTPAMLLPLAVILADGRRRVLYALAAFVVFAALPFLPFVGDVQGLTNIFTYHARRPLQIESVPGTPYLFAGALGARGVSTGSAYGSQFLAAPGATLVATLAPWLGVAALVGIYVLVWKRRRFLRAAPQYVPLAALACVLAFTVCNKVLSPQFLVWTFPLVALVSAGRGRGQRICGLLTLTAILLTQIEFPALYWQMVALEPGPVTVVLVRNVVLVAAALVAVDTLWRLPESVEGAAAGD